MSAIDLFKISSFAIQFHDQTSLELMITSCNLPGFTLGQIEIQRPVVKDKRPGDTLEYNDLSLTVLCDEDLKAFKDIYSSIILSANPNTGELEIERNTFQATLLLMTNKNNIQHKIIFYNTFFKGVGDLQLESTTTEGEQVSFTVDLGYSFYNFE